MTDNSTTSLIVSAVEHWPKLSAILSLLVVLRPLIKGICTALDNYAKNNFSQSEYAAVVHFEHSKFFRAVAWWLETLTSVNLASIHGAAMAAANATPEDKSPRSNSGGGTPLMCMLGLSIPCIGLLLLAVGCMTTTTVTSSTNAVGVVTKQTNVLVTVNAANLALDCAAIQTLTGLTVSVTLFKDPSAKVALQDISTAITGIIAGANTNSVSQLAALFGSQTNAAVLANLAPVVSSASSLEQSLLKKYGAVVGAQIGLAIITAVGNGITAGL
jgi:hypothetical protein